MASYDDLFGSGAGDKKYIKWDAVGVTLLFQVTGEPNARHPQADSKTGKPKYMVQEEDGGKWAPKTEGEFDQDAVHAFFPLTTIAIPVMVVGKKDANGNKVEGFEPFETTWELNPDQKDKLKDKMLETRIPLVPGTLVAVKYLLDSKPRKYAIDLKAAE